MRFALRESLVLLVGCEYAAFGALKDLHQPNHDCYPFQSVTMSPV